MPVKFRKAWVSDSDYESVGVFDVNNDGVLDVVSGCFWYEGPDYRKRHFIGDIMQVGEYYDSFSNIPMDVNGNGYLDYITGGWWGGKLCWRENPGADVDAQWIEHEIGECGSIETTRAWDIDGDGQLELIPNTPGAPLVIYKLVTDADGKGTGEFKSYTIYNEPQGHGLGCGDIAGNGRMDIVLAGGWLEAPADPFNGQWIFHDDIKCDFWGAGVPMLVVDVNGDGINDIIVGHGHNFGLEWWEQGRDAAGGRIWKKHPIDPFNSQYHDLHWVDIDGDGQCELVTGKRHRAHNGNDPGEWDDTGLYYFKWTGENFAKQVIDFSRIDQSPLSVGLFFELADLRGAGRLDLIASGKGGLYIYYNEGQEKY